MAVRRQNRDIQIVTGTWNATTSVRTLARGPHTTTELAHAWNLTPPEVSRHLAVLQRAGLVTGERRGRYVRSAADLPALAALGTDLVATVLR